MIVRIDYLNYHYLVELLLVAFEEPCNLLNIPKSKRSTSLSKFLY